MDIFKIDEDLYIEYDLKTHYARMRSMKDDASERKKVESRIAELPPAPTDAELLAWARDNAPRFDYSIERVGLQIRLEELDRAALTYAEHKKLEPKK